MKIEQKAKERLQKLQKLKRIYKALRMVYNSDETTDESTDWKISDEMKYLSIRIAELELLLKNDTEATT